MENLHCNLTFLLENAERKSMWMMTYIFRGRKKMDKRGKNVIMKWTVGGGNKTFRQLETKTKIGIKSHYVSDDYTSVRHWSIYWNTKLLTESIVLFPTREKPFDNVQDKCPISICQDFQTKPIHLLDSQTKPDIRKRFFAHRRKTSTTSALSLCNHQAKCHSLNFDPNNNKPNWAHSVVDLCR